MDKQARRRHHYAIIFNNKIVALDQFSAWSEALNWFSNDSWLNSLRSSCKNNRAQSKPIPGQGHHGGGVVDVVRLLLTEGDNPQIGMQVESPDENGETVLV